MSADDGAGSSLASKLSGPLLGALVGAAAGGFTTYVQQVELRGELAGVKAERVVEKQALERRIATLERNAEQRAGDATLLAVLASDVAQIKVSMERLTTAMLKGNQ